MLERNPSLDAPPFHKSIPFHLGSSGHFSSGCFRAYLTAIVGAAVFCLVLFSYFLPHHLYSNILSEPAATVFLKIDLAQTPVFITYGRYLELTE